ncbi:MAG: threonine--tRNA ligase [Acholeplasmatales bacterium]|nr:threonine--tRNA ligase [Acholeplasmatales bacterium]
MKITFPDGSVKEYEQGITTIEIAKMISPGLAKKCVAGKINGELVEANRKIESDAKFEIITKDMPEAFEILNHSTAHLMAQAIKRLYPNAKFGIGPHIEEGYYYDIDFNGEVVTDADFGKIEKMMHNISSEAIDIERKEISKKDALEFFKDEPYKLELISDLEDGNMTIYTQKDFTDLCRGIHLTNTKEIKYFKLLSIAGAYWRGNSANKMLTRIYGTSWFTEEDLKNHLTNLEERKKRDHRKLGKELGLFMISDFGPGLPFWLPNGYRLRRVLEDYWLDLHRKNGYIVVETPQILSKELWITSGHWDHYKEDMFITNADDTEYAIKPMNCPGAILVYKNDLHSYKDLPIRIAELGHVHRNEASGALNGLFRVRTFTQDDAHTLLTEDQIGDEMARIIKLYDEIYSIFGLNYTIELSTRPDDFIGDIEVWNKAEEDLKKVLAESGKPWKINPGDGAFYGPKLDFKLKDSMNRIWQCGTIQLDMQLPGRFDCTYITKDGGKATPVMIHRACFGSIERFIGIITENFAGNFPLWLAPEQIRIIPVNEVHNEASKKLLDNLEKLGIRATIDDRNEKLGYKIREAQTKKIPYQLVIGDKEASLEVLTYRKHGEQNQVTVNYNEFIDMIIDEIKSKKR